MLTNLRSFPLSAVTLNDSYIVNAYEKEVSYLTSFDTDRLLAGFRETAGLDMKGVERYGGWENMLIGGHTIGHYIAACAFAYETANATAIQREKLLSIMEKLILGLSECQDALGTGLIFGALILNKSNIEEQFDLVEKGCTDIIRQAWVPYYTLHKIYEGLVACAKLVPADKAHGERILSLNRTALKVASSLTDWVFKRVSSWDDATHKTVLSIEYGGIADCIFDVYALTQNEHHLEAAKAFCDDAQLKFFLEARPGDNALNNHHANTNIPKLVSAVKRYLTTGERFYLDAAANFWELVVSEHTYITGNNSEWEHFGPDGILNGERTNCNCETCNAYNMLKLTKLLYTITGDPKYDDWYENTYINTILSSQNPETGMTTYFQPMATGYFKTYGTPFTKFWCCTGSGMENFSKLGEAYYYQTDDALVINRYISSRLLTDDYDITQESNIPSGNSSIFILGKAFSGTVLFRLPDWLAADAQILVNNKPYLYPVICASKDSRGYAVVEGSFEKGTEITVTLPMKVTAVDLPDSDHVYGFKYGPVVLSARLGSDDMETGSTGVDVTIARRKLIPATFVPSESETVTVKTGSVDRFIKNIDRYLLRDRQSNDLSFTLTGTDSHLTFIPHYTQYKERYGLYFSFIPHLT